MTIKQTIDGKTGIFSVGGRLDTTTAPDLEAAVVAVKDSIDQLILDFDELDYISSAGLRVVLFCQKTFMTKDGFIVRNMKPAIKDVFEITGFIDIIKVV